MRKARSRKSRPDGDRKSKTTAVDHHTAESAVPPKKAAGAEREAAA
jgi:hypothetical protein